MFNELIKPVACMLFLLLVMGLVGKWEYRQAQYIESLEQDVRRLTRDYRAAEQRHADTRLIGPEVWGKQVYEVETGLSAPEFLEMMERWLTHTGECNVVIHKEQR